MRITLESRFFRVSNLKDVLIELMSFRLRESPRRKQHHRYVYSSLFPCITSCSSSLGHIILTITIFGLILAETTTYLTLHHHPCHYTTKKGQICDGYFPSVGAVLAAPMALRRSNLPPAILTWQRCVGAERFTL